MYPQRSLSTSQKILSFTDHGTFRGKNHLGACGNPTEGSRAPALTPADARTGLNLYDGATWEIGLALQNEFEVPDSYNAEVLFSSTTGRDGTVGGLKDIRGDTKDFKCARVFVCLVAPRLICATSG